MRIVEKTSERIVLGDSGFGPVKIVIMVIAVVAALILPIVDMLLGFGGHSDAVLFEKTSLILIIVFAVPFIQGIFVGELFVVMNKNSGKTEVILQNFFTKKKRKEKAYDLSDITKIWISRHEGQKRPDGLQWSVYLILKSGKRVPLTPGLETVRWSPVKLPRPAYVGELAEWLGVPVEEGAALSVLEVNDKSYSDDDGKDEEEEGV